MFKYNLNPKKYLLTTCVSLCTLASSNIFALAELNPTSIYNFFNNNFSLSGNGTLTSNYVWRGVSQTNDLPAAQAEIKLNTVPGFYLGMWGSNVHFFDTRFRPATVELDTFGGYAGSYQEFKYYAEALHYNYSGTDDLNYMQYTVGAAFRMVHGSFTYAPRQFDTRTKGFYYTGGVTLPLHDLNSPLLRDMSLNGDVGYFQFNGGLFHNLDYFDYKISLNKKINRFDLNLAWTATNNKFRARHLDDHKIIASVGVTV